MPTYSKITDFAAKDALLTGNPSKIVKGTEIGAEFDSIASADASNVKGPTSAVTDNAVARWDTTTGRIAQGSTVTIDDSGNIVGTSFTGAHNGTVGATTPSTGAFTTLSASGNLWSSAGRMWVGPNSHPTVRFYSTGSGNTSATYSGLFVNSDGLQALAAFDDMTVHLANGNVIASSTGLAVTGALSATGSVTSNGAASGTNGGGYLLTQNGGTSVIGIGGFSGIVGGAYDATPTIYANGALRFNLSGTTQATLDTSGNLGLGVTPSAWASGKSIDLQGASFWSNTIANGHILSNAYYDGTNWRYRNSNTATWYAMNDGSGLHRWYTAPSGTAGNAITFTQAMTLDASGNLLVGKAVTTYSTDGAAISNTGANFSATSTVVAAINRNGTDGTALEFYKAGTLVGSVAVTSTTTTYNTTSDHRLKTNVRDANAARFMDIQFRDFEWIDGRHDCGVIAHELQAVYPDLVMGEKDATEVRTVEITPAQPAIKDALGNVLAEEVPAVTEEQTFPVYQQVNYIGLICRMGVTIQKQQRLIEAMEARLSALEAR